MFSKPSRGPTGPDLAFLVALTATILASAVPSEAQDGTTPGATLSYSTIHSIGIEWGISGDANHNATVAVHYRPQGTRPWKTALLRALTTAGPLVSKKFWVWMLSEATATPVRKIAW